MSWILVHVSYSHFLNRLPRGVSARSVLSLLLVCVVLFYSLPTLLSRTLTNIGAIGFTKSLEVPFLYHDTSLPNLFGKASGIDQDNPQAYWLLGAYCLQHMDYQCAISALNKASTLLPHNAVVHYKLGLAYEAVGQFELAARAWEKTDSYKFLLSTARRYRENNEWQKAISVFKVLVDHSPNDITAHLEYGQALYSGRHDKSGALSEFQKALALSPNSEYPYLYLGHFYRQEYDFENAIYWFKRALDTNPDSKEAKTGLTLAWSEKGDRLVKQRAWADAERAYQEAIAIQPGNAAAFIGYSELIRIRDNDPVQEEVWWLDQALQADPTLLLTYLSMGDVFRRQRDYVVAESWYEKGRQVCSGCYYALVRLGINLLEQNHFVEAENDLMSALKMNPSDGWTHYYLGRLYYQQGLFRSAIEYFQNAVSLEENNAEFHLNLANAFRDNCQGPQAWSEYQRVIELDPTSGYAKYQLIQLSKKVQECHLNK